MRFINVRRQRITTTIEAVVWLVILIAVTWLWLGHAWPADTPASVHVVRIALAAILIGTGLWSAVEYYRYMRTLTQYEIALKERHEVMAELSQCGRQLVDLQPENSDDTE